MNIEKTPELKIHVESITEHDLSSVGEQIYHIQGYFESDAHRLAHPSLIPGSITPDGHSYLIFARKDQVPMLTRLEVRFKDAKPPIELLVKSYAMDGPVSTRKNPDGSFTATKQLDDLVYVDADDIVVTLPNVKTVRAHHAGHQDTKHRFSYKATRMRGEPVAKHTDL